MKTKIKIFLISIIAAFLSSCSSPSFFQLYNVTPVEKMVSNSDYLIYEDENCRVLYNLWGQGGNIGFRLFNKTDKNIFLNLDKSFFVLNETAYNYYKNRIFTSSKSTGITSSKETTASKSETGLNFLDLLQTNKSQSTNSLNLSSASGFAISYNEEKTVCIPSKTSKLILEYNVNETLFRDCDLYKFPSKKQIKPISFSKDNSPFVFSNIINYSVGQSITPITLQNDFFVSEITNYPENSFIRYKNQEFCGQKSELKSSYFFETAPNKFYIQYSKGQDIWEH